MGFSRLLNVTGVNCFILQPCTYAPWIIRLAFPHKKGKVKLNSVTPSATGHVVKISLYKIDNRSSELKPVTLPFEAESLSFLSSLMWFAEVSESGRRCKVIHRIISLQMEKKCVLVRHRASRMSV